MVFGRSVLLTEKYLAGGGTAIPNRWGNHAPGRFSWPVAPGSAKALPRPIPTVGRQGFFWVPWDHGGII